MARKTKTNTTKYSFNCQRCGRCCMLYGHELYATENDMKRWRSENRQDILQWVDVVTVGEGFEVSYDLWINPKDPDRPVFRCPFLRAVRNQPYYKCRIYDMRPEVCRNYPNNKEQARHDKCPGYRISKTKAKKR